MERTQHEPGTTKPTTPNGRSQRARIAAVLRRGASRTIPWCALMGFAGLVVPAVPQAAGLDGPGTYYMFRTFDTGTPLTQAEKEACAEYFGPTRPVQLEVNAGFFPFTGDPATGRVVDQKAGYLGSAIGCLAPALNPIGEIDLFAKAPHPAAGMTEARGPCAAGSAPGQPGATTLNCKVAVPADHELGSLGGVLTSNTVINPRNAIPGTPTGSIWTNYVVTQRGTKLPPPPVVDPPVVPEPSSGLDFYVFRSFEDSTATGSANCPGSLTSVTGVRSSALSGTAPDVSDGSLDPKADLRRAGALTLCFTGTGPGSRSAVARIELSRGGGTLGLSGSGDCRDLVSPAGWNYRQQACHLRIEGSVALGIKGALLTSNGLVHEADRLEAANSHIWTLALFADPA